MSRSMLFQSYGQATPEDREKLDGQLKRERDWYGDEPRYGTNEEIENAWLHGDLVKVGATDDLQPIGRFYRESDLYLPYLTPGAHRMVTDFGAMWRVVLWNDGLQEPPNRLSVTSMTRSQLYQNGLIARGALASPDSTHCTGNAVDIDVAGYYRIDPNGRPLPHGHPDRQVKHRQISEKIGRASAELGHYDARITEAAIHVADLMHHAGIINRILEFPNTPNACLHLAASPDYAALEK